MGICVWALSRQGRLQPSVAGRRLGEPTPLFATSVATPTTDQWIRTSSNADHPDAVGAVGRSVARPQGHQWRRYIYGPLTATLVRKGRNGVP